MSGLLRAAAVLFILDGLGFGACAAYGAWMVATGRGVPTVMGFPSYGGGPFERIGIRSTVPQLVAFLFLCCFEVVAGALVWGGHRAGAWLGFALIAPCAWYWWGFALPIPPAFAAVRSALVLAAWRDLS